MNCLELNPFCQCDRQHRWNASTTRTRDFRCWSRHRRRTSWAAVGLVYIWIHDYETIPTLPLIAVYQDISYTGRRSQYCECRRNCCSIGLMLSSS